MKGLSRAHFETVTHKLAVLAEIRTFKYFIAAIHIVIEKHMTYMLHMYSYLMSTSSFKITLDQRDITQAFKNPVVRNSMLADTFIG